MATGWMGHDDICLSLQTGHFREQTFAPMSKSNSRIISTYFPLHEHQAGQHYHHPKHQHQQQRQHQPHHQWQYEQHQKQQQQRTTTSSPNVSTTDAYISIREAFNFINNNSCERSWSLASDSRFQIAAGRGLIRANPQILDMSAILPVDSSEPPDPSLWLKQHLIHSLVLIPDESLGNLLIKSHGSNLKGFWNQSKKFSTNKSSQPTSHHADHAHHAATHSANSRPQPSPRQTSSAVEVFSAFEI